MKRLIWFLLFAAIVGWFEKDGNAQPPPANITINQTRVNGGDSGQFLKVNPNGTLGQGPGGGGGGVCPAGSANAVQKTDGTDCAASSLTDDGSKVTSSVDFQAPNILFDSAAMGATPSASFRQNAITRAGLFPNSAGTLFSLGRYDNSGVYVDDYFTATRATGNLATIHSWSMTDQTNNGSYNYCASSTGSDTYTCTVTPSLTQYAAGQCITFYPSVTSNTGAATVNVNSLGAKSIKTSSGVDPGDGVIAAGTTYQLCYDGTNFLMPQDQQGSGITTVSLTGSNSLNGKYVYQKITLTGSTTISSITNIKTGALYGFIICQDGTGGWTFTWPASVLGGMNIGTTASKCNSQTFLSDGTSLYASTVGVINE